MVVTAYILTASVSMADGDRITRVEVVSESKNEVRLRVSYLYSGSHGADVFVSARMAQGEAIFPYYAYTPGRVKTGTGTTIVTLTTAASAPALFTSDRLVVEMYVGGAEPFLSLPFRHLKTWMRPGTALQPVVTLVQPTGTVPAVPAPEGVEGDGVERRIGADGSVELRYPDGTVKHVFEGGMDIEYPDGRSMHPRYASAQPPTPPGAPPDTLHADWLQAESDELLDIIRTLVAGDEASVSSYLAMEGPHRSLYERIDLRTKTIRFLLTP